MDLKVEFIEGDYMGEELSKSDSIKVVRFKENLTKRKRGRPKKIKSESEWEMASQGGDTSVTVVPQTQILQVSQPAVSVQLSPENSVDSSHSITVTTHPSIQEEGGVLSSGGNSEDGIQGPETSPGHYITVTDHLPISLTLECKSELQCEVEEIKLESQQLWNPQIEVKEVCSSTDFNSHEVEHEEVIDTIKSDLASESGNEDVTHSYVQYIESTGEQTIYTTSNGQMYPVYTVGESGTMYTPSSGQYYSPGNTTPVTYTQVANSLSGGTPGQLIGNTAYLIQQGVETESMIARASPQAVSADVAYLVNASGGGSQISESTPDSSTATSNAPNIVHATRVSPTTVQWLLENYETAEGVSLPRSTLYNHYLRHCYENKLDPVNAASFGKLIRSVFLGLRTRRLGTRGNSKYHYYGIRLKASSSLLCQSQDSGGEEGSSRSGKRFRVSQTKLEEPVQSTPLQEYLGDSSQAIPELPEVEIPPGLPLPPMCSLEDIDTFRSIYREHCEAFLDAIVNLEFATIETLWREFWRSQENTNGDECEEEKYLSKTKLLMISKLRPIQEFVKRVDFLFYQNLVQVLIPDVLRPIPSSLTQAIRNFAKGLESWLSAAMAGCPSDMVDIKVSAVCALGQTLRRYTSLNHLAQAARAVLQNSVQINQMLADLNRVDFHNVQEQASWVCECDGGLVARLEADFKTTLQTQNSLEEWASWLKAVVNSVLKPYRGRRGFSAAARQLLLKWSFYSSMVIRDLTLRSAASFGSFHLIRLLYDEYMFYLVEHQVASATGTSPIAVMATKTCGLDYSDRNGNFNNNTSINNNKEGDESVTKKMRLS